MKVSRENLVKVISDSIGIEVSDILINLSIFNDIEIDSIEVIKLAADMEQEFNIKTQVDVLKEEDTIENIYKYIVQQKVKAMISNMLLINSDKLACDDPFIETGYFDSANIFQLIADIEDEFNIIFSDDMEFNHINTINKIILEVIKLMEGNGI